ncbi:MAG TPA: small ribosomal subunit Rsm22 family protein [Bryobacteraceae bacterium]|nr:small ribosomal subunit Rsm22 family protein [Bryobacteraceae bacterium]
MQLPPAVRQRIGEYGDALGFQALQRAAGALSDAYRDGAAARLNAEERTAAYLVTRMPATYAAAHAVLREVAGRSGPIGSILDAGAGTGAASLAAREYFPEAAITLLERDASFAAAAREFLPDAALIANDIGRSGALPPHDLVVAAYSLGEFGAETARRLWQAARVALVLIEPGTPRGFTLIRNVREELLSLGARMIAPCPMETACPVARPDWCHFAARVERSSLHRRVKGGELGHEDEKFSYVALARQAVELPAARIVRHPQHHPGLIEIAACTPEGLRRERIFKRDRDRFRAARKAAWGDAGIS